MEENIQEKFVETKVTKNKSGYGYKYTDLAQIHDYLEQNNMRYYQEIETSPINGNDYIMTYRFINGKWEEKPKRGCRVTDATLTGIKNPAQEQGSALTYARRYSLLMAFGLATEDDDAQSLSMKKGSKITKVMENAIRQIISERNINTDYVLSILKEYKCEKLADILIEDYMEICNKFKGVK